MGRLASGPEAIDDLILIKADGYPTYNFGHIVDDHLMKVSHIIRGQEFISSVPKFLSIYEALGFEPPKMAHLPYVMAIEGSKKLSKRDGAKDILDYAKEGILPEAMVNFLATLGWNDGTEQEIFSVEELIKKFDLSRVQHAGAKFDEARLYWMNGTWIRKLELDDLYQRAKDFWTEGANAASDDFKKQVLSLAKDRLKTLGQLKEITTFFFDEPEPNLELIRSNNSLKELSAEKLGELLAKTVGTLESTDFTPEAITTKLNDLLKDTGQTPGVLFSLLRITTTWAPFSPPLAESLCLLGKEKTIKRLNAASETIKQI
jgi:glutamyl-tRNA synthetase